MCGTLYPHQYGLPECVLSFLFSLRPSPFTVLLHLHPLPFSLLHILTCLACSEAIAACSTCYQDSNFCTACYAGFSLTTGSCYGRSKLLHSSPFAFPPPFASPVTLRSSSSPHFLLVACNVPVNCAMPVTCPATTPFGSSPFYNCNSCNPGYFLVGVIGDAVRCQGKVRNQEISDSW